MNTFLWIIIVAVIIFMLTYNPEKGVLNKVLASELNIKAPPTPSCCSDDTYRAKNPGRCEDPHYNGLQFANPNYACPTDSDRTKMGAIIAK
jgi:hypothetical protein